MDSPTNPHLGLAPIIPWEQRFLSRMAKYRLQGRLRGLHCLSLSCFVAADMPREQLRKRSKPCKAETSAHREPSDEG